MRRQRPRRHRRLTCPECQEFVRDGPSINSGTSRPCAQALIALVPPRRPLPPPHRPIRATRLVDLVTGLGICGTRFFYENDLFYTKVELNKNPTQTKKLKLCCKNTRPMQNAVLYNSSYRDKMCSACSKKLCRISALLPTNFTGVHLYLYQAQAYSMFQL